MPVPIHIFRAWASGKTATDTGETLSSPTQEVFKDQALKKGLVWGAEEERDFLGDDGIALADLQPGALIIFPESTGGWETLGYIPEERPKDLGDIANFAMIPSRAPVLRLHPNLIENRERFEEQMNVLSAFEVTRANLLEALQGSWRPDLQEVVEALRKDRRLRAIPYPDNSGYFLVGTRQRFVVSDDDDPPTSLYSISLKAHSSGVRDYAERFAAKTLSETDLVSDIRAAGWLHDIGKADVVFQTRLRDGNEIAAYGEEPLAKSGFIQGQKPSPVPKGWRHELASVQLIENNPELVAGVQDLDLVRHLIESHHGCCRPFAPAGVKEKEKSPITLQHGEIEVKGSTQLGPPPNVTAERFWKLTAQYGWWGLAYLEAVLRLADIRRSIDEQKEEHQKEKAK